VRRIAADLNPQTGRPRPTVNLPQDTFILKPLKYLEASIRREPNKDALLASSFSNFKTLGERMP
jgi:hypothetical protein